MILTQQLHIALFYKSLILDDCCFTTIITLKIGLIPFQKSLVAVLIPAKNM